VVAGLDLAAEPGERVLLAGPSGAGKSTVLHALVGALGTTLSGDLDGRVRVGGTVGFVPQAPGDAVVAERIGRDVAFGPENRGLARREIWARVDRALADVDLPHGRDHPTAALSGGELQRLALAGALALRPDVLLLDEPTSMLDPDHAEGVRRAVASTVARSGATLLVVEHRLGPWLDLVDRVVVLGADGTVALDVAPDVLLRDHAQAAARHGVWLPGLPAPTPATIDPALLAPVDAVEPVVAEGLVVDLVRRSMRGATRTRALDGVGARLDPGRVTAVTGPSGAGKSTLLATVGGLLEPSAGTVRPARARVRSRDLARGVGWLPQVPEHGFVASTVREEVALTPTRVGRTVDVEALLEVVGLGRFAGTHPFRLSGGEQRRLSMLTAVAHRPGLVLLDEPTVGQDRDTWSAVVGLALAAAAGGAVVGVATHDAELVALSSDQLQVARS
jgi:energy-coupling factor transport system ATP-binding protein